MERKPIPEAEVKLAQELCVQMGECSATYYIVLLLGERERLQEENKRLNKSNDFQFGWAQKAISQRDSLREALNELVDDEPCLLDHEGFCQAHGVSKPCVMVKARAALDKSLA